MKVVLRGLKLGLEFIESRGPKAPCFIQSFYFLPVTDTLFLFSHTRRPIELIPSMSIASKRSDDTAVGDNIHKLSIEKSLNQHDP